MSTPRRWLVPTKRWHVLGWTIRATRAFPPRPWRPRLKRHGAILARSWSFRWLTVYITGRRYR